jgi:hypothetical protein
MRLVVAELVMAMVSISQLQTANANPELGNEIAQGRLRVDHRRPDALVRHWQRSPAYSIPEPSKGRLCRPMDRVGCYCSHKPHERPAQPVLRGLCDREKGCCE